jgi:hypothetical protein
MTGRYLPAFAVVILFAPPVSGAEAAGAEGAATCEERLARTLAEMEARPLLKEELATGLMWLRLDAQTALARGDVRLCLEGVRVVEEILGLDEPAG